jgi:hypothetical protein
MDDALIIDLLALVRRFGADAGPLLAARLGNPAAPSAAELGELARRAGEHGANDEELALAVAALLATARAGIR